MGNLNDANPIESKKTTTVNQDGVEVKVETTVRVTTNKKTAPQNESGKDSDIVYRGRLE